MRIQDLLEQPFGTISDLIREHARERPTALALIQDEQRLDFASLDLSMDRVAASLQREALGPDHTIAICATTSIAYAVTFLGALRAGVAVAPLAPSSTGDILALMLQDCSARLLFLDAGVAATLADSADATPRIRLDDTAGSGAFEGWLSPAKSPVIRVELEPGAPFNVIYSSGTTGSPKGIVQPHRMRWGHVRRGVDVGYGPDAVTLVSTPLYSNTTLVSFLPALALGGTVVLMAKFEVAKFLALAERYRVTHAMLVPVQYQRIMDFAEFDRYDLSSFRVKFCTSAPFAAALKQRILERWPGGLVEYYGMTEGGGSCVLAAHLFPDKLHTVGRPALDNDVRLIDENGREVGPGELGEVVGWSPMAMMSGYHGHPEKTREAEWVDASTGKRFIRTGDVGRFDADGFLTLLDRKKDMIISGGFNVYPSDLEAVLSQHASVCEVAVVGVPSRQWGETPVAFVVLRSGCADTAEALRAWINERVGKTQRVSALRIVPALPRSAIGKVLKRELRDSYEQQLHGEA